jgi:hypothetical protein
MLMHFGLLGKHQSRLLARRAGYRPETPSTRAISSLGANPSSCASAASRSTASASSFQAATMVDRRSANDRTSTPQTRRRRGPLGMTITKRTLLGK